MSGHETRLRAGVAVESAPARQDQRSATGAPAAPLPVAAAATAGPLVVGHADDAAEAHADRLAESAVARLRDRATDAAGDDAGASERHRHTPGCGHLRRHASAVTTPGAAVGPAGGALPSGLADRIGAARGAGSALAGAERSRMESAFGTGLGHVRIHRGGEASRLNDAISAEAFTIGSDVFLGAQVAGGGPAAEGVLAHEIAHVVSEPPTMVRRFGKGLLGKVKAIFGRAEPTEEEKAAKAREKERQKAVKDSKKVEKSEEKALAASRVEGDKGRQGLRKEIYAPGAEQEAPTGPANANGVGPLYQTETDQRMSGVNARFEEALGYERGLFRFLQLPPRGGGKPLSEEAAADQAYHQTWHVQYKDLASVRPPRETAAERLVIAVRRIRTADAAEQQGIKAATEADKPALSVRMLSKKVEGVYDRMVVLRDELSEKDPDQHPALVQDEAATTVRTGLTDELAEEMPPKDGPLDVAAWAQATERVAAKKRKAARDTDSIEQALALLPPDPKATAAPGQAKDDPIAKGQSVVKSIGDHGGKAMTALEKGGGFIAGEIGSKKDDALRKEQGLDKPTSHGTVLPAMLDQGVSQLVHDVNQSKDWQAKGLRGGPPGLPKSDATKAEAGFGQISSIFTGLQSAASSALSMAKSTKAAWETDDVYEGVKATKAGATGLSGLVAAAKSTANLAKTIDSGVASGVNKVVPGLDIVTSVLGIVKATMDVATAGMRQRETDQTMFEARARTSTKVDVMVYPLMKVSQAHTKQLESTCWSLGSGIGDFILAVAQVATAGGFGIPAAIKSGKAVLDNLHSLGHFIADQVLAVMAQRAQKESEVLHAEGAAEAELSRHPKMAVDGIVVRAAQGDPVALMFLSNYRISGRPISKEYVSKIKASSVRPGEDPEPGDGQSQMLAKIRTAVLADMGTSADPKTLYQEIMGQLETAKSTGGRKLAEWKATGELANQRNTLAKQGRLGANTTKDRGLGWRVRMFFAAEKRGKLTQRASAYQDMVPMPPGIICVVNDVALGRNASDSELDDWADALTLADLEAELARKPRRNSPQGIELIRDLIRLKGAAGSAQDTADADASTATADAP